MKKTYIITSILVIIILIIGTIFIMLNKKQQSKQAENKKVTTQKQEEIQNNNVSTSTQQEETQNNNEGLEEITVKFIDKIKSTGKVSSDEYYEYKNKIKKINEMYDSKIESQILDENSSKSSLKYYTVNTSQIEDTLNTRKIYNLKEGDIINITIINEETNTNIFDHGGIIAITN